jgi:hypothetical protein
MWRALLVVCLFASPAVAQVNSYVNPYNPYASSTSRGTVQFRPYVSVDRLHLVRQNRAAPTEYVAVSGSSAIILNANSRPAGFRSYPNYPSMGSSQIGSRVTNVTAAKSLQPLPMTAPPPVEIACNPYFDDDSCLSDYAGW